MVRKKSLYFAIAVSFALGVYVGSLVMMVRERPGGPGGAAFSVGQPLGSPPSQTGQPAQTPQTEAEERRLRDLTAREPGNAQHWAALGNLYFDTHRPAQAIDAYAHSLELRPDQAEVLVDKGIMHLASGNPGEAVRHFDKALAVRPGFQPAMLNKGVAYRQWGKKEAARSAWMDLLRVDPRATLPDGTPLDKAVRDL